MSDTERSKTIWSTLRQLSAQPHIMTVLGWDLQPCIYHKKTAFDTIGHPALTVPMQFSIMEANFYEICSKMGYFTTKFANQNVAFANKLMHTSVLGFIWLPKSDSPKLWKLSFVWPQTLWELVFWCLIVHAVQHTNVKEAGQKILLKNLF